MVTIGKKVGDFSTQATGDQSITLSDCLGRQLVLYFYPKDNTPGCTKEGQAFREAHESFLAANTMILGVSRDSVKTHENFRKKQDFPFDLLSDQDETLCQLFDVIKEKNMYGRKYMGI